MSQKKFRLAKTSVRIFPAARQDTAWNSPLSDRQQRVSGNQEIQHGWGNIELVRRSGGENAEKNTPAAGIADLCHLQHPEEGFGVGFYFFIFSIQQTAHESALLAGCLPAPCKWHAGWMGTCQYLTASGVLCSSADGWATWQPEKTGFHPPQGKKQTLKFHYELQLVRFFFFFF